MWPTAQSRLVPNMQKKSRIAIKNLLPLDRGYLRSRVFLCFASLLKIQANPEFAKLSETT
jgi:hypothetical protein